MFLRVVVLVVLVVGVTGYFDLPDPTKEWKECGRPYASQFCDPQNILTTEGAKKVDEVLELIERNTTAKCNDKGFQVAVAVVNRMGSYGYGKSFNEARRFAKDIHDNWGPGYAGCQSGVVMLVTIGDRHMYISTGADVKHILTSTDIDTIFDRMKPYLKDKEYDNAILKGVTDISEVLHGRGIPTDPWESFFTFLTIVIFLVVAVVVVFGAYKAHQAKQKYNECKKELKKIERARAQMLSERFDQQHCPICLTDFASEDEEPEEDSIDPDNIKILPCGHKFCLPCISSWFAQNSDCPVCRKPISPDDDDTSGTPRSKTYSTSRSYSGTSSYTRASRFDDQLLTFYLLSLSRRYPSFVTPRMARNMGQRSYRGSYTTDSSFVRNNPVRSTSSSSSSYSSFGGGSSGGGGGGGGSW